MGQLNLGVFWGYQNNSDYGKFNVLFNYTANGCTLSSMNIKLSKTVDYKYTTNSYIVDSVKVGGTSFSYSPSSGDLSGYTTKGGGPQINLSGSITVSGTSAAVEIKMHRTGQSANAQVFTGTISGLATAPTGLTCSVSNVTETSVTLSGSYSSNGGTEVTSSGYQYKIDGGSWANCTSSVTGLSPTKKYYFRYYATNIVGTSYSSEVSATMYDYPKPTTMENFLIGNGPRITLSNPLRRTVTLQILQYSTNTVLGTYSGNADGVIQSEFATTSAVNSQYQSIPNSKSGTYYCKVTYGSVTKELNDSNNHTYSIKQIDAEYPTFTTSNVKNLANNSSHTGLGDTSKFIKGFNNLTGTISKMTLNKYANGDKYNISATGLSTVSVNYSTSDVNFTLGNITNKSFTVTAVDKRGLSRTVTIDLGSNFIDYFKPYIQNGTITRQNGIGTAAIISFSGKYMNWSGLSVSNSIVSIRYKVGSSGSWTNMPSNASLSSSNGTWTLSATLTNTFDVSTKYDIYLEIKDQLGNVASGAVVTSSAYELGTADALLWRDLSNKRLGIRTKPDYTLDVNGDIYGRNKYYIRNGSSYGIYNSSGKPIIQDYNNTNVVVNATDGTLFLGYQNTATINILNSKATIDSNGNYSGNAATATKLGTATKGGANQPIYLNGGTPTVCNSYPTVNNKNIYVKINGTNKGPATENSSSDQTIDLGSGWATTSDLPDWTGTSNNYTVRFNYKKVQIAFIRFTQTATIGNTWGSAMFTCSAFSCPAYQRAFASAPMVSIFAEGSNSAIVINSNTGSATQPPNIQLARGSKANSSTYTISVIAIGYYS